MTKMQRKWLLGYILDRGKLMAPADGELDKKFLALEKAGAIKHYDAMFGNNYYALTPAGRRALMQWR